MGKTAVDLSDQLLVHICLSAHSTKHTVSVKRTSSRQITNFVARSLLAVVLVAAAVAKLADPNQFSQRVGDFGLVYDPLVVPAAWAIIVAELLIGIALVLRVSGSLAAAFALLLLFISALAYGMALGLDIECGCFGPAIHVSLGTQLLMDCGLLLICGMIYWSGQGSRSTIVPDGTIGPDSLPDPSPDET